MSSDDLILPQLLELLCDLYQDTEGFLERTDEAQLWYNRGYANAMIDTLSRMGYAKQVTGAVDPDAADVIVGQELLPWGKAYGHGWEMGRKETYEVMREP
ncbi:MAG: hypothetical protein U9Q81_08080 [Pseudomonadota bacterium]|nr:hypothetical protein [Pseudomonadota bacterium]